MGFKELIKDKKKLRDKVFDIIMVLYFLALMLILEENRVASIIRNIALSTCGIELVWLFY